MVSPIQWKGLTLSVGTSIGITTFPDGADDIDDRRSDDEAIGLVGNDIVSLGGIGGCAARLERTIDTRRRFADDPGRVELVERRRLRAEGQGGVVALDQGHAVHGLHRRMGQEGEGELRLDHLAGCE